MKGAALWQDPGTQVKLVGPASWPPWSPCGSPGFVLASVSSPSFPHLCRSALVFPPVSRCSHGLACPPPGPHPEPGSAFSLSHTAHGCVCIRRTPNRRRFHFWSPASARKCKSKQYFPYFSLCALGSESRSQLSQTVWDKGQMRVSDGAWTMMTAEVLGCFFSYVCNFLIRSAKLVAVERINTFLS